MITSAQNITASIAATTAGYEFFIYVLAQLSGLIPIQIIRLWTLCLEPAATSAY